MAIKDIAEYAHLTDEDIEAIGREFDEIRREIEASRGEADARYIRKVIKVQRSLEITGRVAGLFAKNRTAWWISGLALGASKVIENNELGHNIMHGQWDWMNDPEIHSINWEWDSAASGEFWRHTHNYMHHKYTNILDVDEDIGYGLLRVTRDQPWEPYMLLNPVNNLLLALLFQYGKAVQHLELMNTLKAQLSGNKDYDFVEFRRRLRIMLPKVGKQIAKDYVFFPAMSGSVEGYKKSATANLLGNVIRDVWDHVTIMVGHFADDAEKFDVEDIDAETHAEWYLRQMLGSANFEGPEALHFISGHLSRQIEHHLYPDLPSNRYGYIASRVQDVCDRYDLPYNTGSLPRQYWESWRTVIKLSLPDRFLKATADDAPETHSEKRFYRNGETTVVRGDVDPVTGTRRGLRTAIRKAGRKSSTVDA